MLLLEPCKSGTVLSGLLRRLPCSLLKGFTPEGLIFCYRLASNMRRRYEACSADLPLHGRDPLAASLRVLMRNQKIVAFGIADINPERDVDGQIIASALAVIQGAAEGLLRRSRERDP